MFGDTDTSGETTCEPGTEDCDLLIQIEPAILGLAPPGEVIAPLVFKMVTAVITAQNIFTDQPEKSLMTTSAGWCTACIEEQPKLQSLHNEFGEQGLAIMVVLFEKEDYTPADARMARIWKSRYNLDFSVVADPEFTMQPYYQIMTQAPHQSSDHRCRHDDNSDTMVDSKRRACVHYNEQPSGVF